MTNIALTLEGGGMRGVFTAGVLDFFLDQDLMFSPIYGVSAGACHACSYLSRQRGRALRTTLDYLGDRRYASWHSLLTTGDFFGVDFVYHEIPNKLLPYDYDTFNQWQGQFYATVTNCDTGGAEYLPIRDMQADTPVIQASSSLPLLSRIVTIDGTPYLDGGIADSIPAQAVQAAGHPRQIIVLTQHRDYQKTPNSMMSAIKLRYRKYPQLVESIATRHLRYNAALDHIRQQEAEGNYLVIAPPEPVAISRLEKNRDKLQALYSQGYDTAKGILPQLQAFIDAGASPAC